MSQIEVIKCLKKNGEMSIEELSEKMNLSVPSVWHSLNSLLKSADVEKRILSKEEAEKKGKRYNGKTWVYRLKGGKSKW